MNQLKEKHSLVEGYYKNMIEEEKKEPEDNTAEIVSELPRLLVAHAYKKLKSGEDLTASEMKVCLDVCKAYSTETLGEKPKNILDDVPFDVDG